MDCVAKLIYITEGEINVKTCICDKCGKEIEINVQEEVIDRDKDGMA